MVAVVSLGSFNFTFVLYGQYAIKIIDKSLTYKIK